MEAILVAREKNRRPKYRPKTELPQNVGFQFRPNDGRTATIAGPRGYPRRSSNRINAVKLPTQAPYPLNGGYLSPKEPSASAAAVICSRQQGWLVVRCNRENKALGADRTMGTRCRSGAGGRPNCSRSN